MAMITSIPKDELNQWLEFVRKREQAIYLLKRAKDIEEQKLKVFKELEIVTRYLKDNKQMLNKFKNDEELIKGIRAYAGL